MSTLLQTQTKAESIPSFVSARTGLLQRKCACGQHTIASGECEECRQKREGMLQRQAVSSSDRTVDSATRGFMESRFGHDFSQVPVRQEYTRTDVVATSSPSPSFRIPSTVLSGLPTSLQPAAHKVELHNDQFAHRAVRGLSLEAFVVGEHIYFGEGRWQPETSRGTALLQHELGHVSRGEGRNGTVEGWS